MGLGKAGGAAPLSQGPLTMVSANAARSDSAQPGAVEPAVSEDGKVVVFVSKTPAEQLVTDPAQIGKVTDTNGAEDVFVWDARAAPPTDPVTTLVSWNAAHTAAAAGNSEHPIMSQRGFGIVFESDAQNLTGDTVSTGANLHAWVPTVSAGSPVFLVNVGSGASVDRDASIAVGSSLAKVAFTSNSTKLVTQASHGVDQVYVRDLVAGTTTMASLNAAGTAGTTAGARDPMISADGSSVVFASAGGDLMSGIATSHGDIWLRSLAGGTTALVSASIVSPGGANGTSANPVISADGSAVAWESKATDLTSDVDLNNATDIFYRRNSNGLASKGALGAGNAVSYNPALSLDGNTVVFESTSSDLVPNVNDAATDMNGGTADVFVSSALTGLHPRLASVNASHTSSGGGASFLCPTSSIRPQCGASTNAGVALNGDGTAITFLSRASDLVASADQDQGSVDTFVRYQFISKTAIVSDGTTAAGVADGDTSQAVVSADGGSAAFTSSGSDLVTPDTNSATDVFEADIHNTLGFQAVDAVDESAGTVTIVVTRTGNNGTRDTVHFETLDVRSTGLPIPPAITNPGDASAPSDYTSKSGTIIFEPGEATKSVTISIAEDLLAESHFELFRFSIDTPTGAAKLGPTSQVYVPIVDNDSATAPAATTTAITTDSPDPSVVGQPVTVQYTVTSGSAGTPTGNVVVSDGTISCTATVAAGQCALTFTSAGARNLTATYAGDSAFAGSTSTAQPHQVNRASTSTSIASDTPDPSNVGQGVAVAYGVAVTSPGAGAPSGNVTVSDGVDSCTSTVAAGTCTLSLTTAGNRTLTATYGGDSSFIGSSSGASPHTVTAAQPNGAPTIAIADGGSCATTAGGATANLTVGDPDGDSLTLTAVSSNTGLLPNANVAFGGSGANRTVTVAVVSPSRATFSILRITASDGHGHAVTVTLTVIAGTAAADLVVGTAGSDIVFGLGGNDPIGAGDGGDVVCGGDGDDVLSGRGGNDVVDGGNGRDALFGEAGNDILRGGDGNDALAGGPDADTLTGGIGADFFSGGPGTDSATDFSRGQGDLTDGTIP